MYSASIKRARRHVFTMLDEVIRRIEPDNVTTMAGVDEDVTFVLPKELR